MNVTIVFFGAWWAFAWAAFAQAERLLPPPAGPHIHLTPKDFSYAKSFGPKDRLVGTYYFYWYNTQTKEHMLNGDGSDALTDHPASLADFSYASVAWHKQQLRDMIDAGINVVLPVFWGAPSEQEAQAQLHWSYAGLPPLVKAREELLREGKKPPFIGLFYDTSTLQYNQWNEHIDLTTDFGRRWFYATVRDFFSLIPPRHWAMLEGKPIILLYSAAFAKNYDQRVIDTTKEKFLHDFGGREPWIAAEVSWRVKADSKVAWGGALGLKNPGVASLGPGYDHSAVPGRAPLVVKRENGKFYEEQWQKFLRRPSHFVMVETWNEFHEGTDIAASKEYGRQYIQLTRQFADRFQRGWKPDWPRGPYTGVKSAAITLGEQNQEQGLRQIENDDGRTLAATADDRAARAVKPNPSGGAYLYFAVDDSFKWAETMNAALEVEYFDAAPGRLSVEFDGSDVNAPFTGAYTRCSDVAHLYGSKKWKTAKFYLSGARFLNSENRGADFRLVVEVPEFLVSKVTLEKR